MRILHVCKKYPDAMGGDAVVVSHLRAQQEAAGHTVRIVTSNCDEITNQPYVIKCGLRDTAANLDMITFKRMVSLLMLGCRMFSILRRERPHVIHTHSIDMAFFISAASHFYGIPVIHTFHIVTFYDAAQALLRRKTELWFAKGARLVAATAPNAYDVARLQSAGLTTAALLPNGVDTDFWRPSNQRRQNGPYMFMTVGRLETQKGYEYLIKAAALLSQAGLAPFQISIIGVGSQKSALQALAASLHVESVITFAGRKTPREIRTLYGQADAAVFPSLYETTPITVLEAWAASVPVIVTETGILRDMPAQFGAAYIVPVKDVQALADAMSLSMSDANRREATALKGYEEAKKYAWPAIAQTAESLYRNAA